MLSTARLSRLLAAAAAALVVSACSATGSNDAVGSTTTAVDAPASTTAPTPTTDAPETTTTTEAVASSSTTEQGTTSSPGDDPTLDALYDRCEEGEMEACDVLFYSADVDSEYEEFADDCGGTGGGNPLCTPDLEIDPDPNSAGARRLVTECEEGNYIACDLLYAVSEADSELEEIGDTCAGLVPDGARPSCFGLLGEI